MEDSGKESQVGQRQDSALPDVEPRIVPMRLQKFLARAGVSSRRGSENLMSAGRVCVNGEVITELGSKVDPRVDVVTVDGIVANIADNPITIALNKPTGYLTTMDDPQGRPCVAALVPTDKYPGLYPIGRLDCDTTGLLLFSTDGELGHSLLHPSHHVTKTYVATVSGRVSKKALRRLEAGVELHDGMTAPALVRADYRDDNTTVLRISIHEGKNRQVRRMCKAVGHEVVALQRISFGPIELGDLESGAWRELQGEELAQLYATARKRMLE